MVSVLLYIFRNAVQHKIIYKNLLFHFFLRMFICKERYCTWYSIHINQKYSIKFICAWCMVEYSVFIYNFMLLSSFYQYGSKHAENMFSIYFYLQFPTYEWIYLKSHCKKQCTVQVKDSLKKIFNPLCFSVCILKLYNCKLGCHLKFYTFDSMSVHGIFSLIKNVFIAETEQFWHSTVL